MRPFISAARAAAPMAFAFARPTAPRKEKPAGFGAHGFQKTKKDTREAHHSRQALVPQRFVPPVPANVGRRR
jgi:hypothetical protein